MDQKKFAARLNAFKIGANNYWPDKNEITTLDLLKRAKTAGLNTADLNYPDHFREISLYDLKQTFDDIGMTLNGIAMRYYTESNYKLGAFTNPDSQIRRLAIEETKRGIDTLAQMEGNLVTLWMGQDGVDYSFQADYSAIWNWTVECMIEIADHNPAINIALEYKPNEPRAFAVLPDAATTLLALQDIDRKNTGVTLDFAHVLYADEMPAFAANLISRFSRLLGVHLNDGYGKWDNGLMVGSVHPIQTIELLVELNRIGYNGAIYFDTFPDHSGLDPVAEAKTNIKSFQYLNRVATKLIDNKKLAVAIQTQDSTTSMQIVQAALRT